MKLSVIWHKLKLCILYEHVEFVICFECLDMCAISWFQTVEFLRYFLFKL